MTLKPTENSRVRAVSSERYKLNKTCAWPTSDPSTPADDPHHCFARTLIGGDSWFVEIEEDNGQLTLPIAHVVGLSRAVHDDITENRKWIKYENEVFVGYERVVEASDEWEETRESWVCVGPLNPQPGSVEQKPKRKRFKGEQKKARRTISIRIPEGNDYEAYEEKMEICCEIYQRESGADYVPYPFIVLDWAMLNLIETYGADKIGEMWVT